MKAPTTHPNLRQRLAATLLLPMLLLTVVGVVSDYEVARRLTDDAYDQSITGVAEGLAMTLETDRDGDLPVHFKSMMKTLQRIDTPDTWRYVVVDSTGRVIDGEPALRAQAHRATAANPDFHTAVVEGATMRIATYDYSGHNGRATIVVAETLARRRAATGAIVGATFWPNLALILLAIPVVLVGVRVALRPLDRLRDRMAAQRPDDLTPLPLDGTPRETLPLLNALNKLIDRLRSASESQQVFLNHAAHQLRTPLAALQTQVELLRDGPLAEAPRRTVAMHATVVRLTRLTSQVLALARTDRAAAAALDVAPVSLPALIADLATTLDDHARSRGVSLAFELEPLVVEGVDWMLREMLMNLVDNAIAHSPPGTQVVLRCGKRAAPYGDGFIDVEDEGEGIPIEARERVFLPFVRLADGQRPGSGLGLAIVRRIVERHHATVVLKSGRGGLGTLVRIRFT